MASEDLEPGEGEGREDVGGGEEPRAQCKYCPRLLRRNNRAGYCTTCRHRGATPDQPPRVGPNAGPAAEEEPGGEPLPPTAPRTAAQGRSELAAQARLQREAAEDYPFDAPPPPVHLANDERAAILRAQATVAALLSTVEHPRVRKHLLKTQMQLGMAELHITADGK
jgi:hypothetical protein